MTRRPAWVVAPLALGLAAPAPAGADFAGSTGGGDTLAQAFGPLLPTMDASGGFRSADDIDYAPFEVPRAQRVTLLAPRR